MILGRYRCKLQIRLSVGIEIGLESRKLVTVEAVGLRFMFMCAFDSRDVPLARLGEKQQWYFRDAAMRRLYMGNRQLVDYQKFYCP